MRTTTFLKSTLILLTSLAAAGAAPHANPNPLIPVHLRVEAPGKVIFNGLIITRGHDVTTASGGTHHCDGTNNNQHPLPGATPTAALVDAGKRRGRFTVDGTYFASFDDFFITTIDGIAGDADHFWLIKKNGVAINVGGCQEQLEAFDKVSFTFVPIEE